MMARHLPGQTFLFASAVPELRQRALIFDYFAGAGGASTGIEQALGRAPDVAINHCEHAVAVHKLNHPSTDHYQVDVWDVDPRRHLPPGEVQMAWFSPDCRHFSRAKGGKPASKRVRGLAWVVCRVAESRKPRVIFMENVPEFTSWGPLDDEGKPIKEEAGRTFRAFLRRLERLGYVVEHRTLNAADYGAPTMRKRLVLIARRDGQAICWPEPTHGPGRAQPYRTAGECIDWSLPCPSIFDRKKPLADATMRRIAAGLVKFVLNNPTPYLIANNTNNAPRSVEAPLGTITTGNRHFLAAPVLVQVNHGRDPDRSRSLDRPMPTITSHHGFALVTPWFVRIGNGEREGQKWRVESIDAPLNTITATARRQGLVVAFLAKHYGGVVGHAPDRPLGTVTAVDHHSAVACYLLRYYGQSVGGSLHAPAPVHTGCNHSALVAAFLAKFYSSARKGKGKGKKSAPPPGAPLDAPAPVVTGQGQHAGLVTVELDGETWAVVDIGLRMLTPRELARCQGFDDAFRLVGTQAQQVARIGNSVSPPMARAVVAANF